jgi:oligopeptide/dipeptide ABC transporter ATP-binding protein
VTAAANGSGELLSVEDLVITTRGARPTTIVDGVSFTVPAGGSLGIVGESGSGKSMTLRAIDGVLPASVQVASGTIRFRGRDLLTLAPRDHAALLGPEIAMIFQEPMTALNPTKPVGVQISEAPRRHLGMGRRQAHDLAVDLMRRTGIPDPERRVSAYPHELSGGLRQRVMIAMALSCEPALVLADEPTTALDVTVQDQVLKLLTTMCVEMGVALVFVTHDLAVVRQTCQDMAVMYAGKLVETGPVEEVFADPRHPYTLGLMDSAPDFDQPDRELVPIQGLPPNLAHLPPGCVFAPRCRYARPDCTTPPIELTEIGPGRTSACRYHADFRSVPVGAIPGGDHE